MQIELEVPAELQLPNIIRYYDEYLGEWVILYSFQGMN